MKPFKIFFLVTVFAAVFLISQSTFAAETSNNKSDADITKEVQQQIHNNLFYTVFDWVTVKTNDGAVTLDGYVHLPWDKSFFENIAQKVDGVKSVKDNLQKVSGSDKIRYKAARTIYTSPDFQQYSFLKDPPIHIIVIGNQVVLEGNVSSETQRSWADLLVQWHTDAFKVENNLNVEKG